MMHTTLIGNEDSYTSEFFVELFQKLNLTDKQAQFALKRALKLATQAYVRFYGDYKRHKPSHEIKKELQKALNHIDKAAQSLGKVYGSGNYTVDVVENLRATIEEKYPSLKSLLPEIIRDNDFSRIHSPLRALDLLAATAESIERTLENEATPKTTARSVALYHWLMIFSAPLEKFLGRKLEQSHYYKGEYVSKKDIGDSELLLFIIQKLDFNVTISQIETALKDTRQKRHEAPWDDYF